MTNVSSRTPLTHIFDGMLRTLLLIPFLCACAHAHPQQPVAREGRTTSTLMVQVTDVTVRGSLMDLPLVPQHTSPPLLPPQDDGPSAWQSAGIGALIGLGIGSGVGLIAANNSGGGWISPSREWVFGLCAGGGLVLGGLVGLIAGSGSGGGGMPYPGY